MTTHSLDPAAPWLFSHLVAENSSNYRAILNVFATAKRQFRLHLRPDDVLAEANWPGATPTLDAVQQALGQLIEWGNLQAQPDTARVATIEDFYRKRLLYRMTGGGEAVEAGLQTISEKTARRGAPQTFAPAGNLAGVGFLPVLVFERPPA